MEVLKELHCLGQAHYDVELPNICFNETYEAVLIDVDICKTSSVEWRGHQGSCLYQVPKGEIKTNFDKQSIPWGQNLIICNRLANFLHSEQQNQGAR